MVPYILKEIEIVSFSYLPLSSMKQKVTVVQYAAMTMVWLRFYKPIIFNSAVDGNGGFAYYHIAS